MREVLYQTGRCSHPWRGQTVEHLFLFLAAPLGTTELHQNQSQLREHCSNIKDLLRSGPELKAGRWKAAADNEKTNNQTKKIPLFELSSCFIC